MLNKAGKSNEIVIWKSDKDGKIILLDFSEYNVIMAREFSTFTAQTNLFTANVNCNFKDISENVNDLCFKLHLFHLMLKHVLYWNKTCDWNKM